MCDWFGWSGWWVLAGGGLQFAGVGLLIRGIRQTGLAFDEKFRIGEAVARTRFGGWWRRRWDQRPRLLRRKRGRQLREGIVDAVGVADSVRARGRAVPPWDQLDPMEAAMRVHESLSREVESLHARIDEEATVTRGLIEGESRTRADEDAQLTARLRGLALRGLANELFASVLILAGIVLTAAAGAWC